MRVVYDWTFIQQTILLSLPIQMVMFVTLIGCITIGYLFQRVVQIVVAQPSKYG